MLKSLSFLVVWLLVAASTHSTYAQSNRGHVFSAEQSRSHVLQTANEAAVVLEGRVVAWRGFWDPKHESILTANKVEVYTLLKGHPALDQGKYIEVITLGGVVGDEGTGWKDVDEVNLPLDAIGLFFLSSYTPDGMRPVLRGGNYWQASSGVASFWRYTGSPWTGEENAAHVPGKGIYRDIPASIQSPIATVHGRPSIIVPGFDAAHFASHNPFPEKQREGAPAKKKTSGKSASPANEAPTTLDAAATPVITSFSPRTLKAGTFDLLTINGSDFGPGQPTVFFTSADSPTGSIECPAENVLSFSNTRIEVYVPSNNGSNSQTGISAGTGEIYILTSDGRFAIPPTPVQTLTITRSEITYRDPTIQPAAYRQTRLVNANNIGGYTLKYDATVYDNPPALHAVQAAIQKWRCETQLNIGDDVKDPVAFALGTPDCNITFVPSAQIRGLLMATSYTFKTCVNSTTNARFTYTTSFDIRINQEKPWFYPTTSTQVSNGSYDFKTSILHELGHAIGLDHVADNSVLMYYKLDAAVSRFYLSSEPELGGAMSIKGRSATQQTCTSNAYTAMQFLNSQTCQGPAVGVSPTYYVVNRCTLLPSSVTLQASGASNYKWASKEHFSGTYPTGSVVTASTAPYTPIGVYVTGTNGFGGSAVVDMVYEESFNCNPGGDPTYRTAAYPNPSDGSFTIDYTPKQESQDLTISLFDHQGNSVREFQYPANAKPRRVLVHGLAPGLYFLRTVEGNRLVESQQLQVR